VSQASFNGLAVARRPAPGKADVVHELGAARGRMLDLLAPLSDEELCAQYSALMSPLVWDLAHCAHFEELWLIRALGGSPSADSRLDDLYNAFAHERSERAALELLTPAEARRFGEDVRARSLELLDQVDLDGGERLLQGAFVYGMLVQHEHQHVETMLQTLQLRDDPYPLDEPAPRAGRAAGGEVAIDGGTFVMGTDDEPWAYDNERPAHGVELAPFLIDRLPVTNAEFADFVAAGGYDDPQFWHPAGWAFTREQALDHPAFWRREGAGWSRRRFGHWEPLPAEEPVQHVCWYEADAYARWAGKRLPTEAEWERAASTAAGEANLGSARFAPDAVGSFPAEGPEQLFGDVWEWTASDFTAYPGFEAFPYAEYSEVFFGSEYKVLRGGSWATHPAAMRMTFRNWDYPIRRQLFAGFRCARDA
jgi:gamma-glutamyl hercynylcysteine S-oxide synthase